MTLCACGKPSETFGGQCDRCASLHSLGLGVHASPEEIESAYLALVKVWHPDRFPSDPSLRRSAEDKLKEINAAHDFLVSSVPAPQSVAAPPQTDAPAAEPARQEIEAVPKRSPNPRPFVADEEEEESEEIRRILRRQKPSVVPRILLKVGFAIGAVATAAIIWFAADAILSSNEKTQRWWEDTKTDLGRELHSSKERIAPDTDKPQEPAANPAAAPAAPTPAPVTPSPTPTPKQGEHVKPAKTAVHGVAHVNGAQPYVTSGLTPMEVLSALGTPTSSNGEKMFYGSSEIDFKNGQVAGWKIDPKTPIRVKLWADAPPVPGVTTFGRGSSKNDVISLQGTPGFFSENEFGYGNSSVFFQNNHVVSWREDRASSPLRVPH